MVAAEEVFKAFVQRINENAELLEGWSKAIQIVFDDTKTGFWLKIGQNGSVEKTENGIKDKKEYDFAMNFKSPAILSGILDQTNNAQNSFLAGDIKVDGSLNDLLKLNPIF
jgi:hypothetical protein